MNTPYISCIKGLTTSLIVAILSALTSSCQKSPINGDLDGQWQVMEVSPEPTETITEERLYYCFYMHTCQLTEYGDYFTTGNFTIKDDILTIEFPFATSPVSIAKLKQYGIYSNPVAFEVEQLDKKKMVLRDGDVVISLRKF